MESEKDGMDSLFEGMVLFNPTQILLHDPLDDDDSDDDLRQQQQKQQHADSDVHSILPPGNIDSAASASLSSLSSSASQPLDENLFSDLTLTTSPQATAGAVLGGAGATKPPQSDPYSSPAIAVSMTTTTTTTPTSSSPISIFRQISTRKKKRAGLRIGYGRDHQITDENFVNESPECPPPQSSSPLSSEIRASGGPATETGTGTQVDALALSSDSHPSRITTESTTTGTAILPKNDDNSKGIDSDASSIGGNGKFCPVDNLVTNTDPESDITPPYKNDTIRIADEANSDGSSNSKQVNGNSSPIELRFEKIRTQIYEKLKHAREVVASVSASRKDTIRRRRKAAENLSLASIKYGEMEKELEKACEAEDFETADRVSMTLASAENDKEFLAVALRDAEAECDAVDSKMQELLRCQIEAEEECAALLQSFAIDAAHNADLILNNAELMSSKEISKWLSSTEAAEIKRIELEIESHLINEARLAFDYSIEQTVKDDRRKKDLLLEKKGKLTEELEELLALVKQKEAEIAENDYDIRSVENRISDAVSSFQEVQSSINNKYDNLQLCLSEMELHNKDLCIKRKEIDDFLSQEEGREAKIRELARISADEANVYQEAVGLRKSLVQFISKSMEEKVRLAKTGKKLLEDVQVLKQEVSAARVSLQELSSTKSRVQQEIESFKQRLLFVGKRVPELEAEKRVAATARNFKEAARLASEAKALYVEKEGIQTKMEGAIAELEQLEEEISDTARRLQEAEQYLSSKDKELSIARFRRLRLIAGAAISERSAALELGDFEEADILLGEAEAADMEARELQPIYNFKDDEFENFPKHLISMDLVSKLGGKRLAELVEST